MEGGLAEPSLQRVGDGVHAWIQPVGTWGESNAGLIAGDGESLLVDTLWDETLTRRMLGAMAEITAVAPIRTVVNTHSDGDHWWGNAVVPPNAEIVTSEASLAIMRQADPAEFVRFKRLAGALARLPGRAGSFGRYTREMLGPFRFDEVTLRPATRSFAGEETLRVGGRQVRLIQVGPAHTPGDLVVHVPDARVVFAADVLFVGTTPVIWAGPVSRWQAALDTLVSLDAEAYVPGHGPVSGPAEVRALRDYLAWVDAAAQQRLARGSSVMDTARELVLDDSYRDAPWAHWDSPGRIVVTIATIDRHRRAAAGGVGGRERAQLFAQ